ncbi:hypothetical protein Acr_27g0000970 [Actinidia rufa]|uniref:Uncharacterized protein n=1 Tax=Actinidia rufa TaxID=165716 RepID=A0A7J0H5R4_9ERIC|nr:hypothetical protein Acr_27g0000970 [Actinidia rufa]
MSSPCPSPRPLSRQWARSKIPRLPEGFISIRLLLGHITYHHGTFSIWHSSIFTSISPEFPSILSCLRITSYSPHTALHSPTIKGRSPIIERSPEQLLRSSTEATSNFDCWRLLPQPSTRSPLENQAHPMASNKQTPSLEGLHCEMHEIAEQIKIMNENNALLIQRLTTNNPPPPAVLVPKEVDRSRRFGGSGDQACSFRRERSLVPFKSRSSS